MPKQTTKSGLAAKFGGRLSGVIQEASTKEIDYGRMDMPGGVKQGVAQLTDCYFKEYETGDYKGEYFFRAAGVAQEPESVGGKRVKGLYTSLMEPCCDTKKADGTVVTKEEHMMVVINEMRKLGADMDGVDENSIEAVAAALKETAPYFRFSTSEGKKSAQYPTPRVFENWHGNKGLEDYVLPEGDGGVQDNSGSASSNGQATTAKKNANPAPAAKASAKGAKKPVASDDVPFGDKLDMLVDKADGGDEVAQAEIQEYALKIEISEKEIRNTTDWAEVAELIRAKESGESGDSDAIDYDALGLAADEEMNGDGEGESCAKLRELASEAGLDPDEYPTWAELATALTPDAAGSDEAPVTPKKGEIWYTKPKGAKKAIECEVIAVFDDKETANLKNLDDGKTHYKNIPFSQMSPDP